MGQQASDKDGDGDQRQTPPLPRRQAPRRQTLPKVRSQQDSPRNNYQPCQDRNQPCLDSRCKDERGQEAKHDTRQTRHDFDRRFHHASSFRVEKFTGVNRRQECQRHGEDQGIESRLERTEDERHQTVLGFKVVTPARRLPYVFRLRIALVPDRTEDRGPRDLRMGSLDVGDGERLRRRDDEAIVFGREDDVRRSVIFLEESRLGQQLVARHMIQPYATILVSGGQHARAKRGGEADDSRAATLKVMRGDPAPPITFFDALLFGAKPDRHISLRIADGKRCFSDQKRPRCNMTVVLRNQVERFDQARRSDSAHVIGVHTTIGPHHEHLVAETGQSYPTC